MLVHSVIEKSVTWPSGNGIEVDALQVRSGLGVHMFLPAVPPLPVAPAEPVVPALPVVAPLPPLPPLPIVPAVPVRMPPEPPQFEKNTTNESDAPATTSADNLATLAIRFRMLVSPFGIVRAF